MITLSTPPAAKAATTRLPVTTETAGTPAAGDAPGKEPFSAMLTQACAADALPGDVPDASTPGLIPVTGETELGAGAKASVEADPASATPTPEMLLAMLSDTKIAGNHVASDVVPSGATSVIALAPRGPVADAIVKMPLPHQAESETTLLPAGAKSDARLPELAGPAEPARRQPPSGDPADRLSLASTSAESASYAKTAAEALADRTVSSASAALAASAPVAASASTPMMAVPAPARAEVQTPATITIGTPVGNPYFGEETAQQVSWLVGNGIEQARINVHPADLGPIEIRISVNNNEAIISFAVTQPATSAAIEDAMPRLREMLADNGISLGQTSVGGEGTGFGAPAGESAADRQLRIESSDRLREEVDAADTRILAAAQRSAARNGMVDLFA